MKKTIILNLVFMALLVSAGAQENIIRLSFTSHSGGVFVRTDSIVIENINHPCDTVLYYPDSVLVLDVISGLPEAGSGPGRNLCLYPGHPNPFSDRTTAEFYLPGKERIGAVLLDRSGKELARLEKVLPSGMHALTVTGARESFYILNVRSHNASASVSLIGNPCPGTSGGVCLAYDGPVDPGEDAALPELKNASGGFYLVAGDTLRYTGYGKTAAGWAGSSVVLDPPVADSLYFFSISEGLPCSGIPSLTYCGRVYTTRQIGTRCWMRENLDAGTRIDAGIDQANNGILEKYCYNNDPANCSVYGALYQWDEAMQYSMQNGTQGICPPGWHLPKDAEWTSLSVMLGGDSVAGGHLKESGYAHWMPPNLAADDSAGFCALPAGMYFEGAFHHFRYNVEYWSSTNSFGPYAWYRILYNDNAGFVRSNWFEKTTARSVRCIRD